MGHTWNKRQQNEQFPKATHTPGALLTSLESPMRMHGSAEDRLKVTQTKA